MGSERKETILSKETLELAKKELREDESTRDQALESMRTWVEQNPRIISCRTDDSFLLRFLRFKKFSVPMAQEAMERYLLLRQTLAQAFHNLDMHLPRMSYLLSKGYLFASPGRDKYGRRWIIARPGVFDPYKYINEDMCRIHGIVYETLMEDQENQIRGFVHFADGVGVSFPYLTLFTPKEAVRIVKNGERTVPMRHKEVHVINVPSALKYVLDWGMTLISEKIKKRVKIYTSIDEALKTIDTDMLPQEYGGKIPMAEMIERFKEEIELARPQLLDHDKMEMRLELFSENAKAGAVSALKAGNTSCNPYKNDLLCGSFRKLEVD
ncbi:clavesin-1-like [Cimex lectularius]|uniref:CRAL-TRIO domain-containing protein n=1 Tax=Cimex lectularius TaxID=79782 RepID=A0A8I6RH44_CIMLE|nr:clavesin-1-like [Cimex lectularius]XP_014243793.1 clavesin-1-like [Cimex lectularius]